jgi:hypothetical protein
VRRLGRTLPTADKKEARPEVEPEVAAFDMDRLGAAGDCKNAFPLCEFQR